MFLMFDQGEKIMAEAFANKTAPQNWVLKLFKNNQTLTRQRTEADFTIADFTGYADIPIAPADWTATPGAPTLLACVEKTFSSTADQTAQDVHGYILVQAGSGKAACGWLFESGGIHVPYTISKNGEEIKCTPKVLLKERSEV